MANKRDTSHENKDSQGYCAICNELITDKDFATSNFKITATKGIQHKTCLKSFAEDNTDIKQENKDNEFAGNRKDRGDRQSVMVELNMQNKNIKNKHIKNDNKKRQSAHIKQINSKYSNVNQRANAYKHINYQEFTAYNPLNESENKIENENENENVEIERYKHFSAANESEANFDLDD
eukprot:66632_1